MKGLIIVNQELGHNKYKIERLKEEGKKLDLLLDVFVNDGTLSTISSAGINLSLPKADFVIYLDKDIYLARILEKAGYRLFNKADFIKLCDDKSLTCIKCSEFGVSMPKTITSPLVYSDHLTESNYDFLEKVGKELNYPYVLKKVYGSLGTGVYLIHDIKEAHDLYSKFFREPLQFQEYISDSFGKSMRVLIIDKEVVGCFIRFNENDFRSNYGQLASGKKAENVDNYLNFAKMIAEKLDIEYAGIDLLFGKQNQPILCEINSNAFFEEFEKITRINVAERFLSMIIKKVKNN